MTSPDSTESLQGRRARKRQRMASHLAVTAFELFEQHGYELVTMEQIAAEADVAKATLYNYFPVKEALVAHRFKEEINEGMGDLAALMAAQKTFASRMRFLLRKSAVWHAARRAYLPHYLRYINTRTDAYQAEPDTETASSATWVILTTLVCAGQQSGEVDNAVPAEKLAWSLEFLLYGAISWWLAHREADLADEFEIVLACWLQGIAVQPQASPPARTKTNVRRNRTQSSR